jgi:hypothetical protein
MGLKEDRERRAQVYWRVLPDTIKPFARAVEALDGDFEVRFEANLNEQGQAALWFAAFDRDGKQRTDWYNSSILCPPLCFDKPE